MEAADMKRIMLIAVLAIITSIGLLKINAQPAFMVQAAGDVVVKYLGVPLSGPVFEVMDMVPGDCEDRQLVAKNNGNKANIAVRADVLSNESNMADKLKLHIDSGGVTYYDGSLSNFFNQPVVIGDLDKNQSRTYSFEVCFDTNSGNELQAKKSSFNLVFMQEDVEIPVPAECSALAGTIDNIIEGTDGRDVIRGTRGNDVIYAKGGNDDVSGGLGHDCIIGGADNDKLDGGIGNDIVAGGEGNDEVNGGVGIDKLLGDGGNDRMDGGVGDDSIYGGEGNDNLKGGIGNDRIYGEAGNDTLSGGIGVDFIDGGDGNDNANGELGRDTCIAEVKRYCEL